MQARQRGPDLQSVFSLCKCSTSQALVCRHCPGTAPGRALQPAQSGHERRRVPPARVLLVHVGPHVRPLQHAVTVGLGTSTEQGEVGLVKATCGAALPLGPWFIPTYSHDRLALPVLLSLVLFRCLRWPSVKDCCSADRNIPTTVRHSHTAMLALCLLHVRPRPPPTPHLLVNRPRDTQQELLDDLQAEHNR